MRLSVVVGSLFFMACGPSSEAKPIEIVNIPQPSASSKPAPIAHNDPPPEVSERTVASGGPTIAKRDPRRLVMKDGEVDTLEKLLEATSKTSPDRPTVLRHLGDAAEALARSNAADGGDASTPRKKSISAYKTLVNDYPNLPTRDEALYYMGLGQELSNDLKNARASYYDLIKSRPDSKFIPHAYFAFGEAFFKESAGDPTKLDLAIQAYTETLKYPREKNGLYAASLYRMGQVYRQKGDTAKAHQFFDRLDKEFKDSEEAKLPR